MSQALRGSERSLDLAGVSQGVQNQGAVLVGLIGRSEGLSLGKEEGRVGGEQSVGIAYMYLHGSTK